MKITIAQKQLKGLLARVAGLKDKKNTMPILGCVLLAAKDSRLTVSASDLEIGIQVTGIEELEIHRPGQIAVPSVKLKGIIDALPDGDVTLEVLENLRLEITSGESIFRVACEDPAGSPNIADKNRKNWQSFSMHATDLHSFIDACLHCICPDDTKYHLCGIFLQVENGRLVAVSTDGHRLSLAGREIEGLPEIEKGIIIPRKGVDELRKLESDHVGLHLGKNKLEIIQNNLFLSIRLLDGDYPDYRKVIPTGFTSYCTVDSSRLAEAVNRVRLVHNHIVMKIEGKAIILQALNENDECIDAVGCEITGTSCQIRMNARFLLDTLSSLKSDEIVIKYLGEKSPLLVLPTDYKKWDERLLVLMPLCL